MGALHVAPMIVQNEPLFVNDIEAARCVLLAPHRIPLKEFTSLWKKPEVRSPCGGTLAYSPRTPQPNLRQKPVLEMVQELKELREDRLLSYILDQRDLRIGFAHCSVNPGTVHRKAAKKPRTTYGPAVVDPRSQRHSDSQLGAGLLAPTCPVTRDNLTTSQAAGASQVMEVELSVPIKEGGRSPHTLLSMMLLLSLILLDPQLRVRHLRGRVYAIEIALGLGPGGQAAAQAGKPGALEVFHQDLDTLSCENREVHGCADRRLPASALKEHRRDLDALSHEVHGRIPSYEPQEYSYHSGYGRTRQIVLPLKTPLVERRVRCHRLWKVNGIRRAMSGQDHKGSNEAMLQLVALYRANHL
ncbi:hypothetical protein PHPALM_28013 [Phytophthora palmivora]|uniref:Uncharacterized protein n=1 Tax=Phytophthora palmivora TaxID=4796 RepID=A0A2P4XB50_9STRA|nr:hypothetical protein PHPALM_28013 [Phytophthora palmivora]